MTILDQPNFTDYAPTSEEKTMALLSHVLSLVAGFLAPLVIYLVKKDESAYVRQHAASSLNFQLTMMIAIFGAIILSFVLIGIPILIALGLANLVLVIIATIKASEAKTFQYPLTIKFVS